MYPSLSSPVYGVLQICCATFQNTLLKILRGEGKNTWKGLASGINAIQCIYVAAYFKEMFMLPIATLISNMTK